MQFTWQQALSNRRGNKDASTFPGRGGRMIGQMLRPAITPGFVLPDGAGIFPIGAYFARAIEDALTGFTVPTLDFSTPEEEGTTRPNGLLNESNPGTTAQRILHAFGQGAAAPETIVVADAGMIDLLLPGGSAVTVERAGQRRAEIDAVYARLPDCAAVILSLSHIEAWFDRDTKTYLNRFPPPEVLRRENKRFVLRVLDLKQAYQLLEPAVALLADRGIKVLLSVSPMPLQTTLSGVDAVSANMYSKSVSRVCAQMLCEKFTGVDYFPSYEMAMSAGLAGFEDDHIRVRDPLIGLINQVMLEHYTARIPSVPAPVLVQPGTPGFGHSILPTSS